MKLSKKLEDLLRPGKKVQGLDLDARLIIGLMGTRDAIDDVIRALVRRRQKSRLAPLRFARRPPRGGAKLR